MSLRIFRRRCRLRRLYRSKGGFEGGEEEGRRRGGGEGGGCVVVHKSGFGLA